MNLKKTDEKYKKLMELIAVYSLRLSCIREEKLENHEITDLKGYSRRSSEKSFR